MFPNNEREDEIREYDKLEILSDWEMVRKFN